MACPVARHRVSAAQLPPFEQQVLEELPDGSRKVVNRDGVVIIQKEGAAGIPTEIDHLFKGRKEWEELFAPTIAFPLMPGGRTCSTTVRRCGRPLGGKLNRRVS